jgi:hypothetical protein
VLSLAVLAPFGAFGPSVPAGTGFWADGPSEGRVYLAGKFDRKSSVPVATVVARMEDLQLEVIDWVDLRPS